MAFKKFDIDLSPIFIVMLGQPIKDFVLKVKTGSYIVNRTDKKGLNGRLFVMKDEVSLQDSILVSHDVIFVYQSKLIQRQLKDSL